MLMETDSDAQITIEGKNYVITTIDTLGQSNSWQYYSSNQAIGIDKTKKVRIGFRGNGVSLKRIAVVEEASELSTLDQIPFVTVDNPNISYGPIEYQLFAFVDTIKLSLPNYKISFNRAGPNPPGFIASTERYQHIFVNDGAGGIINLYTGNVKANNLDDAIICGEKCEIYGK